MFSEIRDLLNQVDNELHNSLLWDVPYEDLLRVQRDVSKSTERANQLISEVQQLLNPDILLNLNNEERLYIQARVKAIQSLGRLHLLSNHQRRDTVLSNPFSD